MKHLWSKLLFAMMIAALLLVPSALMEEEVEYVEPVDVVLDEQTVDIVTDDTLGGDEVYTYSADTYDAAPSDELFAASGEVAINATNFPDETLRNYLLNDGDTDRNGSLSAAEIANIKELKCNPNDFTGIKYLTSVESISTGSNTVTLDVSGLTNLKSIGSQSNVLSSLNVKGCTSLEELDIYISSISTLDLSGMTKLKRLSCGPSVTSLNVSGCTDLTELYVPDSVTSLDASGCTSLTQFLISSTSSLTSLNLSGCTSLNNLDGDFDKLVSLDISGCTSLKVLRLDDSEDYRGALTSLNVSGCTALERLHCYHSQLTSLDVSYLPNLSFLNCSCNALTWLNVTGCTNLDTLSCSHNQLTSLDVSGCTNLEEISCENNQLTYMNLANCPKLWRIYCENNQFTSLDLSGVPTIEELYCSNNHLTSLNIKGCTKLYRLECGKNNLKKLDISGIASLVKCYEKGKHKTADGQEKYTSAAEGKGTLLLQYDTGVTVTGAASKSSKSSSSSSTKTKLATKKLKVTAYVGTPVQMDTNGETGKSFKSSNKKVATVNSKGVVTPKAAGKAKITYKTSTTSYTVTLTVKDLTIPKWVVLNMKGTVAAKVGDKVTLTPTMNEGAVSKFKWTTSDKKIATVKNGVVTFKKKGTVTITVTTVKGNKKAKVKFKVSK